MTWPSVPGPYTAQSNLCPRKNEASWLPKGGSRRLCLHVAGRAHRRALPAEQAATAEIMEMEVEELTLPQGGDSKMED